MTTDLANTKIVDMTAATPTTQSQAQVQPKATPTPKVVTAALAAPAAPAPTPTIQIPATPAHLQSTAVPVTAVPVAVAAVAVAPDGSGRTPKTVPKVIAAVATPKLATPSKQTRPAGTGTPLPTKQALPPPSTPVAQTAPQDILHDELVQQFTSIMLDHQRIIFQNMNKSCEEKLAHDIAEVRKERRRVLKDHEIQDYSERLFKKVLEAIPNWSVEDKKKDEETLIREYPRLPELFEYTQLVFARAQFQLSGQSGSGQRVQQPTCALRDFLHQFMLELSRFPEVFSRKYFDYPVSTQKVTVEQAIRQALSKCCTLLPSTSKRLGASIPLPPPLPPAPKKAMSAVVAQPAPTAAPAQLAPDMYSSDLVSTKSRAGGSGGSAHSYAAAVGAGATPNKTTSKRFQSESFTPSAAASAIQSFMSVTPAQKNSRS